MNTASGTDIFYGGIPVFRGFASLMDPKLYSPLPGDWSIGVADIVESTKAIAAQRYKAVNMAGAAVIAAVTNALEGREFPFVFGGDGASFAVAPSDVAAAQEALAATAVWVSEDLDFVMRVARGGPLLKRRAVVLALTLWAYAVMRLGIKVGDFVPKNYVQQVVENSDFRKYDDGLKMILDCTEELERALTERLKAAASAGILRYGLHRQDAAMMTCFVPSVMRSDHVHFIDGARGGYATAATALKAM